MPDSTAVHSLAVPASFDFDGLLGYLSARAVPGVETVEREGGGRYRRTLRLGSRSGWVAVSGRPRGRRRELRVELSPALEPARATIHARVRRLLDLEGDAARAAAHLAADAALAPLVARRPGLRLPGTMDRFELAVRAVLGQQVSVAGANTLAGRLVRLVGVALPARSAAKAVPLTHLPVAPDRLAAARPRAVAGIGIPGARGECLVALARAVADGEIPELAGDMLVPDAGEFIRRFTALPGIGAWTAEYVAMRALGWRDAFPVGDLGLRKAMGGPTAARLRERAEPWRPWRAYAAQHLWAGLADREDGTKR